MLNLIFFFRRWGRFIFGFFVEVVVFLFFGRIEVGLFRKGFCFNIELFIIVWLIKDFNKNWR